MELSQMVNKEVWLDYWAATIVCLVSFVSLW
jgi:hypothetical protein